VNQEGRDGKFAFVVTSVDPAKTAHDPSNPSIQQSAQGMYVNVHLTVKNVGNRPQTFFADNQRLWVGDRHFIPDGMAAVWAKASSVRIDPGSSITAVVSFDVPDGTTGADTVELHDSALSPGVQVLSRP
jgi:archaellum component FlaG (FlaF/FlaG flagellin family)